MKKLDRCAHSIGPEPEDRTHAKGAERAARVLATEDQKCTTLKLGWEKKNGSLGRSAHIATYFHVNRLHLSDAFLSASARSASLARSQQPGRQERRWAPLYSEGLQVRGSKRTWGRRARRVWAHGRTPLHEQRGPVQPENMRKRSTHMLGAAQIFGQSASSFTRAVPLLPWATHRRALRLSLQASHAHV